MTKTNMKIEKCIFIIRSEHFPAGSCSLVFSLDYAGNKKSMKENELSY